MKYVIDGSPIQFEVGEIRFRNLRNGFTAACRAEEPGGIITNVHALEFQFEDEGEQETFAYMVMGMMQAMVEYLTQGKAPDNNNNNKIIL